MSALRVELFFDEEAGNWHYRVPALHINGGGTPTREDAERDCLSAIAFALEGDPRDYDTDAETLTFDVNVAPAARAATSAAVSGCFPRSERSQRQKNASSKGQESVRWAFGEAESR
jgi:hypothetical protein